MPFRKQSSDWILSVCLMSACTDVERDECHIFRAVPHWNLKAVVYGWEWFCGPTIQYNQCIQCLNKS